MELLLDFVNVKEWDLDSVRSIWKKHRVGADASHTPPLIDGHCVFVHRIVADRTKREMFFLFGREELKREGITFWEEYDSSTDCFFPSSAGFEKLFDFLSDVQADLLEFVENCRLGIMDLRWLGDRLGVLGREQIEIATQKSKWNPVLRFNVSRYKTAVAFERYIREKEIIIPAFGGEGQKFSRIGRCTNCGDYYVGKSRKRQFCSDKCKNDYHYRVAH